MEEELKQNTQQPKDGQSASPKHMSIRSILGGDILANDFFKRQTRLLILIMILTVLYIDNRYSSQQELIEIEKRFDRYQIRCIDTLFRTDGKEPPVTY